MKKILFLSLLGLPVLFLWGCSLINSNDNWINTWDIEKISQLEQQLSGLLEQFSWLQTENELLKEYLSWAVSSLKTLQEENQMLKSNQENNKTTNQNNNNTNNISKTDNTLQYINKNDLTNVCLLEDSLIKKSHEQKLIRFQYQNINTNELDFSPYIYEVLKHNWFLYFAVYIPTSKDSIYDIYQKQIILYRYDCSKKTWKNIIDFWEWHPYFSIHLNTFASNNLNLSYIFPDAWWNGAEFNYNIQQNTLSVGNSTLNQNSVNNILNSFN